MYTVPTEGEIHNDHIYLKRSSGEAWLSWRCVLRVRFSDELVIIDWTNGVTGNTVLTQSMFADVAQFRRTKQKLASLSPAMPQSKSDNMQDFFSTQASVARLAQLEEPTVAEINHCLTNRDARRQLIADIPFAIFQFSWPMHAFFGVMVLAALILTYNKLACVAVIA